MGFLSSPSAPVVPPPAPPPPRDIVAPGAGINRAKQRRRSFLAGAAGQNRTTLATQIDSDTNTALGG